jgi:outer membrane murein-binding lipoprotein Lpp
MKKINIITIIAVSLSLLFASCFSIVAKDSIKGDGELITKSIEISDFSEIEIETQVKINYSQEKNMGNLEFTVDGNLWEYYDIYTKNSVLHIKLKEEYKNKIRLRPTKGLIAVSSEQLEKVDIAGSADFHFCTAFASEKLSISVAGCGDIFANKYPVQIEDCKIGIVGSGDVHLAGAIQKARIDIAGSGDMKALDCEIAQLYINIAGSGDVEAHVTDKLDVSIAGSGDVKYKGDPVISKNVAGSGKIKKL